MNYLMVAILFLSAPCTQETKLNSRGPLRTNGQTIFQLSSSGLNLNGPLSLQQDETDIHAGLSWINTFNYESDKQLLDNEILKLNLEYWHGITDRVQVGIGIPTYAVGGGFMDPIIDLFHRTFNFDDTQDRRDSFENNEFQTVIDGNHRKWDSELIFGDLTLKINYRLTDATADLNASFGVQIQLPTSSSTDWFRHNGLGIGYNYTVSYPVDDFLIYGAVGWAVLGDTEIFGKEVVVDQFSGLFGVDWQVAKDISLVGQVLTTSGIMEDFHEHSQWAFDTTFGIRVQVSQTTSTELAIMENIIRYNNSSDFGVYWGFNFRY